MMEAKPVLFNTKMVQAILSGQKTVTRRVIKPQPKMKLAYCLAGDRLGEWVYPSEDLRKHWYRYGMGWKEPEGTITDEDYKLHWKPPVHPGDVLYSS
jgi:hypothetical protein